MQPTAKEKFVSFLDRQLAQSPVRQFGAENREQRQTTMESKYGGDLANNTAGKESTIAAAIKGHTQLIGDRPSVDIDKHPVDEQGKYFEANAVTKNEGSLLEKLKNNFETINKTFKEKLVKTEILRDVFKVKDLIAVGEDGTKKELNKADYFKKSEIEKFVNLDPEKHQKVEVSGTPAVATVEDPTTENADKLIEGLYGKDFKDKLNQLLTERLDLNGKNAGDPTFDLVKNLRDIANHNSVMITPIGTDTIQAMIINAVKASILTNPKDVKNIITSLNSGTISVSSIPGLQSNIENGVLKLVVDEFVKSKPNAFIPVVGGTTEQEAKDNRKVLVDGLKNGNTHATIKSNGVITHTIGPITKVSDLPQFTTLNVAGIGPRQGTDLQDINGFKSDLYRGLRTGVIGEMAVALKQASRVMSAGDQEKLFNILIKDGLMPATDPSKNVMDRLILFAQMENKLEQEYMDPSITPALKKRIEDLRESLVAYSTPEGIAVGVERDMLSKVVDGLVGTGGITGLDKTELLRTINEALRSEQTSKSLFERLSVLVAGVSDNTKRGELNNLLRSVADVEIIREIAMQKAGKGNIDIAKQYMLVLMNKFVFSDGNNDAKAQSLLDLLYAKPNADKVITLDIAGDPKMKEYLEKLLGPSITLQPKLEVNGLTSSGFIYARAHELLGTIRKGVEAGEWKEMATKSDTEIKKYLAENFGMKEDATEMDAILARFKEVVGTGATGVLALSTVIDKAKDGSATSYGSNYTNLVKMFRHYIIHGGELDTVFKDFERQSLTQFVNSVQKQANANIGSVEGDVVTDKNRVLSVEEQRLSVFKNYEELSGASGFKGFLKRMVASVPRVLKAAGFMAIASLSAAFPIAAGPIALGLAAVRIFSAYKTVTTGIPMIQDMWKRGDSKMAWAMAAGVGVNVLVNTLVPTPWGIGLSLVGEIVGTDLFAMKGMRKEAKVVVDAHNNYDTAFNTYFATLNTREKKATVERIARSIGATVTNDATDPQKADITATLSDIVTKRDAARAAGNATLLREYSQVVESLMDTEVALIREANKKAQGINDDTQRTIMSYAIASSATKLGFGIGKGWAAGWNDGEGGILGGVLGAVGIADYKTLLDFNKGGDEAASASQIYESDVTELENRLESQFDRFAIENGLDSGRDDNVLGLVHTADGQTLAMIDLDGDTNTIESFVPLDANGNLVFPEAQIGGGEVSATGMEGIGYTAVAGDSQWSIIENTLRQAYPQASDHQIYNATANIINEATPGGVYEQVYDHRTSMAGGAIHIGDRITLQDISEMAPGQFGRMETTFGGYSSVAQTGTVSDGELNLPSGELPANITGAVVFDTVEGTVVGGDPSFINQYVSTQTDDGTGGGSVSTTTTTSDDSTTQAQQTNTFNWRELLLGRATTETGGGNLSGSEAPKYDTFTIKDPGLFGDNAQIDESKVSQIIVQGKFEGMPATIINPSQVDVVEVTKNGVTYLDQSGEKVFIPNERGDISFKFVGVDQPVSFSEGTDNILDALNNLAQTATQVGREVADQTGEFASTTADASKVVEDLKSNIDRVQTGVGELMEDISNLGYKGAIYDSNFSGVEDFPINQFGVTEENSTPYYIGMISIEQDSGSKLVVPLEQVIKLGGDYLTYINPQTNELVTVNGTNVVGVGTTYSIDTTTGAYINNEPKIFEFTQTGKTEISSVDNPWWDTNIQIPTPQVTK